MDVQSFPLDPARLPRVKFQSLWNPNNKHNHVGSPHRVSLSRNAIILKANRRDVIWGVGVETLLVCLSTIGSSTILGFPELVSADDDPITSVTLNTTTNVIQARELVKGRITLAPSVDIADPNSPAALYITCRPDKIDSVPLAIIKAYNGKAPPVLSVRLPNPTFPMDFVLKFPNDLTLEGGWDGTSPLSSTTELSVPPIPTPRAIDELWWNKDDLIVSVRWDSDGIAATRSPEDLVGRGLWKFHETREESFVEIPLTGRGAFGKFATGPGSGSKK